MSRLALPLRVVAVVGPIAVLFARALSLPPAQPRQEVGFVVLAAATLAVGLTLSTLLRWSAGVIVRHLDLLVPYGLYVTVADVSGRLLALVAGETVAAPRWTMLTVSLSLASAWQIVLAVFYGGWVTALIVQAVRDGRVDLVGPLRRPWRWFGRVCVAEALGLGPFLLLLAAAVAVGQAALPLAVILLAVGCLAWNLATAALLPVVVASAEPLGAALADGLRWGWRGLGRWWYVVVVQMLLMGWLTFLHASYTISTGPGNVTTLEKTNWGVNAVWTGGYDDTCRWYGKVAEIYETPPLAPITTLLEIVFAVLAVAAKLRIARDLRPQPVAAEDGKMGGTG
jgi:hypothetical protein